MNEFALVDTGFVIALVDKTDENHTSAVELSEYLDFIQLLLPWPVFYETLSTKMLRKFRSNPSVREHFDKFFARKNLTLIDDTEYRESAKWEFTSDAYTIESYSLVDRVLMEIIKDPKIVIHYVLTFDSDFDFICAQHSIQKNP